MEKIVKEILNGISVRENLIRLKEELKEASCIDAFLTCISFDMEFFRRLLYHEDAKVRKNIIKIIGLCGLDGLAADVFDAYQKEETQFLKAEYIKVLKHWDCKPYEAELLYRLGKLKQMQGKQEWEKHTIAELRQLNEVLSGLGAVKKHQFIGGDTMSAMILTTLSGKEKYLKRAIDERIGEGKTTLLRGGVRVESSDYDNLMKVRCFQELLFVMQGAAKLSGSAKEMVEQLMKAGLMDYLVERISGLASIPFRVELRGLKENSEKTRLTKQLSEQLERQSRHDLVNAPSNYAVEFRFHKKQGGDSYSCYMKIGLLPDERFSYRRNVLPTSIQPYVAAMIMEIAKDYKKEWGQVLDPFCGVGTMLMECNYRQHAHSIYGVDIYQEGIEYAIQHAKKAKMDIHYIHKDMRDFTHNYLFDFIVTDLPSEGGQMTAEEIAPIYEAFLDKCSGWMAEDAIVAAYTKSPALLEKAIAGQDKLILLTHTEMYKQGKSALYILRAVRDAI